MRTGGLPCQQECGRDSPGTAPPSTGTPFFAFGSPSGCQGLAPWAPAARDGWSQPGWLLALALCDSGRVTLAGARTHSESPGNGASPVPNTNPRHTLEAPTPFLSIFPRRFVPNWKKRRYLLGPTRLFQEYLTLLVPPGNQTSGSTSPISQLWQPKLPLVFLFVTEPPC